VELIKNGGRFELLTASKRKKAHEKKMLMPSKKGMAPRHATLL
jgi:hypothetical protein